MKDIRYRWQTMKAVEISDLRLTLGSDIANTVDAIGPDVSGLRVRGNAYALTTKHFTGHARCPIASASRVDHLEENVAAAGLKIDDAEFENLEKVASAI